MSRDPAKRIFFLTEQLRQKHRSLQVIRVGYYSLSELGCCPITNDPRLLRDLIDTKMILLSNETQSCVLTTGEPSWFVPMRAIRAANEDSDSSTIFRDWKIIQLIPALNRLVIMSMNAMISFKMPMVVCEECGASSRSSYKCYACGAIIEKTLRDLGVSLSAKFGTSCEINVLDTD